MQVDYSKDGSVTLVMNREERARVVESLRTALMWSCAGTARANEIELSDARQLYTAVYGPLVAFSAKEPSAEILVMAVFVTEMLRPTPGGWIVVERVYDQYEQWAEARHLSVLSLDHFMHELWALGLLDKGSTTLNNMQVMPVGNVPEG